MKTAVMGWLESFLPKNDRYAAMLLYGMVLATCFNGYDAGNTSGDLGRNFIADHAKKVS